jgi:hypothetical protein
MNTAWMLYSAAANCGDFTQKKRYLSEIIDIVKSADCECCGETDSFPVQVVPVCGAVSGGIGTTVVVDTCNNGITVTTTTVGTTTTYNVCLDLDILGQNIANYLTANPLSLTDLSDVTLASPSSNEILVYNGTQWVNGSIGLGDLSNVTIAGVANNEVLTWNGSAWVNLPLPVAFNKAYTIGSYTTPQSLNATGAYTDLDQALPLATGNNPLSANGDLVEFVMVFRQSNKSANICGVALNGTFVVGSPFNGTGTTQEIVVKGTITRVSATQLHLLVERTRYTDNIVTTLNTQSLWTSVETVADITGTPLVIAPFKQINSASSDCVYANYKSIKK